MVIKQVSKMQLIDSTEITVFNNGYIPELQLSEDIKVVTCFLFFFFWEESIAQNRENDLFLG